MSKSQPVTHVRSVRSTASRIAILSVVVIGGVVALGLWQRSAERAPVSTEIAHAGMQHSQEMTVYKSPACVCCGEWIAYLRARKIKIEVVEQVDVSATKSRLGVPNSAISCHTATIDGYVVEGHVPLEDIERLLTERPAVVGIAAPGMPTGAPGMDGRKDRYTVVTFDRSGTLTPFATHN